MNAYRDRALRSEINYRLFTLLATFGVVALIVAGAVVLGVTGRDRAAIALGAATGVTLVAGAFLNGRDLFPKAAKKHASVKTSRGQDSREVAPHEPVSRTSR